MSREAMKQKVEALQSYTRGPLSSSITKLSGSSRGIPSEKDFHFYNNFAEFKDPVKEIADKSKSMLDSIGTSSHIWGKEIGFLPDDFDEAIDWLVSVNDEVLERFDASVDEFERVRKREEEMGVRMVSSVDAENGFQLVCGKKKRGVSQIVERESVDDASPSSVKMASRDKKTMGTKPKVPYHIPSIPRPQDEFKILVNNSNQPFEHVWLQRSEDGSRFIHPLEKCSILDFVDNTVGDLEPVKPPPLEFTPFKLVEDVKDLKVLAAKLRGVNEFAVDLEHNHYRSFQGLTCLMQLSTRSEDFIVDTLKLRVHVGPYLREVFKDPTKRKVMHGADRDIVWLQRDFGVYVCNLFDTGQASRVLKLERNSLEHLLSHFCGVTANKEYQNADWRLRPLPEEMVRYAREDTHYLLHIYDLMRIRLLSASVDSENSDSPLVEVYQKSSDICMQLYEKELLTESSYLYIYGLQGADLNAQQLAIVAGLCEWRDIVARAEDESTGFILPNRTLLEIAKQMPITASKLRRLLRSKHPYVERNLNALVSIISHSIQNAAAFEAVAEHLKETRMEIAAEENVVSPDLSENHPPTEAPETANTSILSVVESLEHRHSAAENGNAKSEPESFITGCPGESIIISGKVIETNTNVSQSVTGATVQVLKKPSRAFGALLGSSATKRKLDPIKKEEEEMKLEQIKSLEKEAIKLEQIKSSVNFPFHSFSGGDEKLQLASKDATKRSENLDCEAPTEPPSTSNLDDIISLDSGLEVANEQLEQREDPTPAVGLEMDDEKDDMSLSDLSSSFQKCFQSLNESRKTKQVEKPQDSGGFLQLTPFDYEAARKEVKFGEERGRGLGAEGGEGQRSRAEKGNRKNNSTVAKDEESGDFAQGRRRQAFPSTGNRSATFR